MAKAGWYNDDLDPTLARWFDGEVWTEHVTDKAYWESVGHEPPAPYELMAAAPDDPGARRRAWIAVGSAAAVGLVAIAGVALAQRGGGDQPDPSPTARRSESTSRTTDPVGVTDDLGAATSLDPIFGTDVEDGGGAVAVGGGSTRTTAKGAKTTKTTTKGGVTHTETRSESHTAPNITSSPPGGDKTSVGHSTNTSISTNTTIKTSTTTSTAPPATDGGDPGGGDDGGTTTPTGTDGGSGP